MSTPAPNATPTTLTASAPCRFSGCCRSCGTRTSVLAANTRQNIRHSVYGWAGGYLAADGSSLPMVNGSLMMPCRNCGRDIGASRVRGIVKAHIKCNAKCLSSKGHSCECSCGGKNHGAGFDVAVAS